MCHTLAFPLHGVKHVSRRDSKHEYIVFKGDASQFDSVALHVHATEVKRMLELHEDSLTALAELLAPNDQHRD